MLNAVNKGEEQWLEFSKEGEGEFSGSGTQNPVGSAHNSSD